MRITTFVAPAAAESRIIPGPLSDLGLSESDLAALRTQGAIVARPRGRNRHVYLLRYRTDGRERAIFLGVDRTRAAAIGDALKAWQQPRRDALQLERMHREAGQLMRSAKAALSATMQN